MAAYDSHLLIIVRDKRIAIDLSDLFRGENYVKKKMLLTGAPTDGGKS